MLDKKNKNIVLIGGGDFTKKVIKLLTKFDVHILGYIDVVNKGDLFGISYLGKDDVIDDLNKKYEEINAIICIAGNIELLQKKTNLVKFYKKHGCKFPSFISESAYVDDTVEVEEGVLIFDQALVDFESQLGSFSVINLGAMICHNVRIGSNTIISPRTVVTGGAQISENCFIGTNVTVNPYIKIIKNTIIGSGSVVQNTIHSSGVYVGSPLKKIK